MGESGGGGGDRAPKHTLSRMLLLSVCRVEYTKKQTVNDDATTIPTAGFNVQSRRDTKRKLALTMWDVGIRCPKRVVMFRDYTQDMVGLIYVVDSADIERLETARSELHKVLELDDVQKNGCVVLVACNKQDLPYALSAEKIAILFEPLPAVRSVVFKNIVANTGQGMQEAFDALAEMIYQEQQTKTRTSWWTTVESKAWMHAKTYMI